MEAAAISLGLSFPTRSMANVNRHVILTRLQGGSDSNFDPG